MISSEELKKNLDSYYLRPFLLKLDESGEIETNRNCLNVINIEQIHISKENFFQLNELEKSESYKIMGNTNFSNNISFSLYSNTNLEKHLENIREELKGINSIEGKYEFFSINYASKDLSFQEFEIKKIKSIAEEEISDEEKAQKLYNLFLETGYFIPKKVYYGGIFYNKMKNEEKIDRKDSKKSIKKKVTVTEDYNFNLDYNSLTDNDLNNIFKRKTTKIKGGDIHAESFQIWKKSININNSIPIRFTNMIEVKDILDESLLEKLKRPLEIISDLFKARKDYLTTIKSLKAEDLKPDHLEGVGNFVRGICQENKKLNIQKIEKEVIMDHTIFNQTYDDYTNSFKGVIVGFKIIDKKKKGHNSKWIIKENPILKKNINIHFVSEFMRGFNYKVEVYYIQFPNSIEEILQK